MLRIINKGVLLPFRTFGFKLYICWVELPFHVAFSSSVSVLGCGSFVLDNVPKFLAWDVWGRRLKLKQKNILKIVLSFNSLKTQLTFRFDDWSCLYGECLMSKLNSGSLRILQSQRTRWLCPKLWWTAEGPARTYPMRIA